MYISTTEDNFDCNFRAVLEAIKEEYPHLRNYSSEDLQNEMWNSSDLQKSFTRKMIERAVEHGGDEMFDQWSGKEIYYYVQRNGK